MKRVCLVAESRMGCLVCNIVVAFAVMMVARLVFFVLNIGCFAHHLSWQLAADMLRGALLFDTSAIISVNALYVLLMLLPFHKKETAGFASFTKCLWMLLNGVALAAGLCDCVYFEVAGRRLTAPVLWGPGGVVDAGGIIATEAVSHWYLVIIFGAMLWAMWRLGRTPALGRPKNIKAYYAVQSAVLLALVPVCVAGVRGSFSPAVRPIAAGNALAYVNRPIEAAVVLNTPFSLLRTMCKRPFVAPNYMTDTEMEASFSPLHLPMAGRRFTPRNVVVMIVDNFGREYSGLLNSDLDGGSYSGFTPFLDSIMAQGTSFRYSFGNGLSSADALASVLLGIPKIGEPFFPSPASLCRVTGIAGELRTRGYHTAFLHDVPGGDPGFRAFARSAGFSACLGIDECRAGHPDAGLSGQGVICDEPFLQICCEEMNGMRQPFLAAVLTAPSRPPYAVPAGQEDKLPSGNMPVHKRVGYTDMALRRFFESAKKQKWYRNTLFVITANHPGPSGRRVYQSDLGAFAVPLVLFAPGDSTLRRGIDDRPVAQHTDVMPTVLGYLGYDRPYVAFGCDLLHTPPGLTCAVSSHNGTFHYVKGEYLLQFNGSRTTGFYRFKSDRLLQCNLVRRSRRWQPMERELKAIIQQYMQRTDSDNLVIDNQ